MIEPTSPAHERILIIMPAFNEEASVAAVIREVRANYSAADVLVVDDGSTDRTVSVARAEGATVLSLPFNLGVGGAMRLGFKYAIANGFTIALQIDSDGQHDPKSIERLVREVAHADLVIGARFAGSGDYEVRGPRKWAMKLLSSILSRISKARLTDTTSGFKACGPRAIRLFAEHYPAEYLGDTVEALVIASREELRITQVPVSMRQRSGGEPSHNPTKAAVYLGRVFIALVFAVTRPRRAYRIGTKEA